MRRVVVVVSIVLVALVALIAIYGVFQSMTAELERIRASKEAEIRALKTEIETLKTELRASNDERLPALKAGMEEELAKFKEDIKRAMDWHIRDLVELGQIVRLEMASKRDLDSRISKLHFELGNRIYQLERQVTDLFNEVKGLRYQIRSR